MEEDPYGAIKFGEFRKYMQNKQSKLKEQEKQVVNQGSLEQLPLFKDCSIHINGYTNPPSSELRRMILQHGGDYQHYLLRKSYLSSVTHIIATNLTNSKIQEFRAYKVILPEWITKSIESKRLLPWQNFRLVSQSTAQKELTFTGEELNKTILSNDWVRKTTTVNPEFIKRYYENSRLHHLSVWKGELKEIVTKLQENNLPKKRKIMEDGPRVFMHVDFDCFFASVGIRDRPELKNKPVAVSHSKGFCGDSSSDIASCNYVARTFDIRNGMTVGTAKQLCPQLHVIPYEFEKYRSISEKFYEILFQYADVMQAVSVDEAILQLNGYHDTLTTKIRAEIREATGCEASIGVGPNILLARLSTKRAKPAGQFYCQTQDDIESLLESTSVSELPGVGYVITQKLKDLNIETVTEVRKISKNELQAKLGAKMGQTLFNYSHGIDDRELTINQKRQSVSAEVNWGLRFEDEENEKAFIEGLSKEVSDRLIKLGLKGKTITLKIMKRKQDASEAVKHLGHGKVDSFSKSNTLANYTDDPTIIKKCVYSLLKSFQILYSDVRGIGIQVTRLDSNQEILPPNQETLKFKASKVLTPEVTTKVSTTEIPTVQQKEEMLVDYSVYQELPEAVQQELQSNYDLKFQQQPEKQEDWISELPPWSQVDPASLLALPNTMREQVIEAYGNKKKRQHTPESRTTTLDTSSLSQMEGLPYDVNVWNELPLDVRTELLAEHRLNKQVELKDDGQQKEEEKRAKLLQPSFQGFTDINDLRNLLSDWVKSTQNEPEIEDVTSMTDFFSELVRAHDLEKSRLLIIYLTYLTKHNSHWKSHIEKIKQTITNVVISMYGYPLQF
ncbi:hypothetical protein MFLAVUS_005581 [Mucor flavus]|uniref:DNA repair protein REV1 n=1 Tax=Mucor flavus TaxID=439312 RepID=A0ABP9YZ44_9FUNG